MVAQAHAQTDHDFLGLPAIIASESGRFGRRFEQHALQPFPASEARGGRDPRRHPALERTARRKLSYGPPVPVAEDAVGHMLPDKDSARRSLYLQARRTKPVSLLATFDSPTMAVNCDRRAPSTSAMQSLVLMNSDFILSHAGRLARSRAGRDARGLNELPTNSLAQAATRLEARLPARDHTRRGGMGDRVWFPAARSAWS